MLIFYFFVLGKDVVVDEIHDESEVSKEEYQDSDCSLAESLGYEGDREQFINFTNLKKPLVNRGYVLFADNFNCSVPLFQYLISVCINAVGTVKENSSSFPRVMKNRQSWGKKLDKGTIRYIRIVEKQNHVLFVKWVDRNVASVPSTYRSANNYDYCTRNTMVDGSHKKVKVLRPKCISDYNQDMNGLDLSDQIYHICIQFNIGARSYGKHYSFILLIFVLGMHICFGGSLETQPLSRKCLRTILFMILKRVQSFSLPLLSRKPLEQNQRTDLLQFEVLKSVM